MHVDCTFHCLGIVFVLPAHVRTLPTFLQTSSGQMFTDKANLIYRELHNPEMEGFSIVYLIKKALTKSGKCASEGTSVCLVHECVMSDVVVASLVVVARRGLAVVNTTLYSTLFTGLRCEVLGSGYEVAPGRWTMCAFGHGRHRVEGHRVDPVQLQAM